MDDMAPIEIRGLSPYARENIRRKAAAAHMSPEDYVRALVEADARIESETVYFSMADDEYQRVSDAVLDEIAEHRKQIKSEITNEDILAALHEGRRG
ncbi:hypothetical protein HDA32_003796 [Spinactinospora alkalitolerans]|uniref:Antitoxin n=1 Tax=Spinactinospora alkalitolerans TaxID=687207 RepID=A0A852TVZ8_9ACTN|nr:hypothetical protein [Spinactinospora alkalitolerans]NYE48676.1 hypothetical protein [Spinactinospora alkalitolerans]